MRRPLAVVALLASLACSRTSPATHIAPPADVGAPVAAAVSLSRPLPAAPPAVPTAPTALARAGEIPLPPANPAQPSQWYVPGSGALLRGEGPGPDHLLGTVIRLQKLEEYGWGYGLQEWDLASAQVVRRARLDLNVTWMNLIRPDDALLAIGWRYSDEASFIRIAPDLRVLQQELVGWVSVAAANEVASDPRLTVVVSQGTIDPQGRDSGIFAASFDAGGRKLAERRIAPGPVGGGVQGGLAVVEGSAYVALMGAPGTLSIVRLGPGLEVLGRATLPVTLVPILPHATLLGAGHHLLLDVEGPDLVELSLDLARRRHVPRPAPAFEPETCGRSVSVGSVIAAACACGAGACIRWRQTEGPVDAGAD